MNRIYIPTVLMIILIAGCIQLPPAQPSPEVEEPAAPECRVVYVEEPYVEEECRDVIYSEEECTMKELEYTAGQIVKTDLCTADGGCVGKSIYDCLYQCERAMKRCQMNITNNDEELEGTWTVGATFSYDGASFVKNPQSVEILPGKTHTFDFEQIYQLGDPPTGATCTVTVIYPAIVKDCVFVEKTRFDCENVSKTRIVQQEICD